MAWALAVRAALCAGFFTVSGCAHREDAPETRAAIDARDAAIPASIAGSPFPTATLAPPSELGGAPAHYVHGDAWVSEIVPPDRTVILHLDRSVATAEVSRVDGERAWFGVTEPVSVRGGFGRTYQVQVGATVRRTGALQRQGPLIRLSLPVENPSAHNLAVGERRDPTSEERVWRIVAPTERGAAFSTFELFGTRDVLVRLTSQSP